MKRTIKMALAAAGGLLITLLVCMTMTTPALADMQSNIPMTLRQPDGGTLECFASGDEYFNYLHDANGYLIMQHPRTGYYVYAAIDAGARLVASDRVAKNGGYSYDQRFGVSSITPMRAVGITVGDIDFAVNDDLVAKRESDEFSAFSVPGITRASRVEGIQENVVVMICFSDEDPAITSATARRVNDCFNGLGDSLNTYTKAVSGGVFEIHSTLVGMNGATALMYKDDNPRGHYQPYNAATNPNGYTDNRSSRESALIARAINAIDGSALLAGKNLDADGNGIVDCISFVVNGQMDAWNDLLWPHMHRGGTIATLNGKRVNSYTLHLLSSLNVGTIAHETLHNYSYPDLYRYGNNGTPVGIWDIMASSRLQLPTAHTNLRYGGWGEPLVEITENGRYTLSPRGSKTGITAYAIQTDSPGQFIVLEYRNSINGTGYDAMFNAGSDSREGLIISRINTQYSGNDNADYSSAGYYQDEIYVYRPNETGVNNGAGIVEQASLSSNVSRASFGHDGGAGYNGYIYLSEGANTNYVISGVSAAGDSISFDAKIKPTTPGLVVTYISGNNGAVRAAYNGNPFASGQTVSSGGTIVFTATPNPNYIVDKWIVNGDMQPNAANTFSLSGIAAPRTVTVTFKPNPAKVAANPVIATDAIDLIAIPNNASVAVTITTSTPGAQIYYTLDGTAPTTDSIPYIRPFAVDAGSVTSTNKRIIAFAVADGEIASGLVYLDMHFLDKEFTIPDITVGNPKYVNVTDADSLILQVWREGVAVPGKTVEIWAKFKGYTYNGATATPISISGLPGIKFAYTLPDSGLNLVQSSSVCTVTIPFSAFVNDTGAPLSDWIASDALNLDNLRAYRVVVEEGAFRNSQGPSEAFDESGAFFSAWKARPFITAISPAYGASRVPASGTIIIDFNRQMNIAAGAGTVSLSPGIGALPAGSWSSDGRRYTTNYVGLASNVVYTISIYNFRDPDGNYILSNSDNIFTMNAPMVIVGNTKHDFVKSDGGLVLLLNKPVTALEGKTITVNASVKSYAYDGDYPFPISANPYHYYEFRYTIPSGGLELNELTNGKYEVTIPFSQLMNSPPLSLSFFMDWVSFDEYKAYRVIVSQGAFVDDQGNESNYLSVNGAFFARSTVGPEVVSITPGGNSENNATSGKIAITFSKQMDKTIGGTVSLSSFGTLQPGAWSEDGRTYTASYSGLNAGTYYIVSVYDFTDPDLNTMIEYASIFKTEGVPGRTVSITFELNGGNVNGATGDVVRNLPYGFIIAAPSVPVPQRDNHVFLGWQKNGTGDMLSREEVGMLIAAADCTFRAAWVPITPWEQLRLQIQGLATGDHVISIAQDILAANLSGPGAPAITIPPGIRLTLQSDNAASMRTLTQTAGGNRHFNIDYNASLTLGEGITLSGGVLNNANDSGGVYVNNGATFAMQAGSVIENCHRTTNGGAVLLAGTGSAEINRARFYMDGGTIRNNSAPNGGGAYLGTNSHMIMTNGTIEGNNATASSYLGNGGGGVGTAAAAAVFTMNGGTIQRNEAYAGGGVMVGAAGASFDMGGTALITNNTARASSSNNGGGGVTVYRGTFTMTGGTISNNRNARGAGVFIGDNEGYASMAMQGGAITQNQTPNGSGGGVIVGAGSCKGSFTMTGGTISYNTALSGGGVLVGPGSTFTMNGEGARISSNRASSGGGVNLAGGGVDVATRATFTLLAGTIGGDATDFANESTSSGGGVYASTNSLFTMGGGYIRGNRAIGAASSGGGVYVNSATAMFAMTGGTISNNHANGDGGGIYTTVYTYAYENPTLPTGTTLYGNLNIASAANFSGNTAGGGGFLPPDNAATATNIAVTATRSGSFAHALNNFDINYKGRAAISVTGLLRSYNAGNVTTLVLMQNGVEKYRTTIERAQGSEAVTQSFAFTGVMPGTYTLVIAKPGHTSLTVYNIVVGNADVNLAQDSRPAVRSLTLLCGDINGDDMINDADLTELWRIDNYNKSAAAANNPLADLNGDGMVNDADLTVLWRTDHYNKGAVVIE